MDLSANRNEQVLQSIGFYDVQAKEALHLVVSLGTFIVLDIYLKKVFLDHNIRFPSALFGMFFLFLLLSAFSIINIGIAAFLLHRFCL